MFLLEIPKKRTLSHSIKEKQMLKLKSEELTGGERPLLPFFPLFLSSTVKTLVTVGKVL